MATWRCALSIALLGLAAGSAAAAPPAPQEGVVTRVTDGDSLWLVPPGGAPIVVRLRDIDAPEICQPWGRESRRALAEMALNQPATLRPAGRDSHGRLLGTVTVAGVDVGRRLVEEGHAWSARTRHDQGPLVKQERVAKALGRGLHGQGGAVMPGVFRRSHGLCP